MQIKTGAVIVAAGMSSRMGEFKPMLKLGAITIVQRVIITLRRAGADPIVVVTGFNADILEKHISHMGAVFLRNGRYADSQMIDSAKIGFSYIENHCDRVLFTPVDVPLFTQDTIKILMADTSPLVIPVYEGKEGHPLLISSALIPSILDYNGDGGLAGAIQSCGTEKRTAPVKDDGILFDADTPEDYHELLLRHNKQLFRPQVRFEIAKELPFFGEGTAMLLEMIKQTGSVKTACQMMRLSYSKGWNMINLMEKQLGFEVIERRQGGPEGGYARLTAKGEELLDRYMRFEAEALESVQDIFERAFRF